MGFEYAQPLGCSRSATEDGVDAGENKLEFAPADTTDAILQQSFVNGKELRDISHGIARKTRLARTEQNVTLRRGQAEVACKENTYSGT
jgi:hypothetical protein